MSKSRSSRLVESSASAAELRLTDYTELWESRLVYCEACGSVFKATRVVSTEQQRIVYPQIGVLVEMSSETSCRVCGFHGTYRVVR